MTKTEEMEAIKVLGVTMWLYYKLFHRRLMLLAHRYNWHYAPPIYPDGETQLWCQWCGFRMTIPRAKGEEYYKIEAPMTKTDPTARPGSSA